MRFKIQWKSQPALVLSCAAILTLLSAGCGRNKEPVSPPAPGAAAGSSATSIRAALIMSGQINDNGWNQTAYDAWQGVRKEAKISDESSPFVENVASQSEQAEDLRAFANKKYNLVFAHGSEYEQPALKMEAEFPQTLFVISSGRKVGKNTMPIVFRLEDGAYLEGMLAAGVSKTGKLGAVGAEQNPELQSVFKAFELGAKSVNPKIIMVKPVYTGSWDDAGLAKQVTNALLQAGADIIMQDVDAAAPAVFQAVKQWNRPGQQAYALGTNKDQNAIAPDVVLASAPIYTDKAFLQIIRQAQAGTLKPNDNPFGMPEGVIDFKLNPALQSLVPAELKSRLESTAREIRDGSFKAPRGA